MADINWILSKANDYKEGREENLKKFKAKAIALNNRAKSLEKEKSELLREIDKDTDTYVEVLEQLIKSPSVTFEEAVEFLKSDFFNDENDLSLKSILLMTIIEHK